MILQYSEAGVSVAASGGGMTIEGVSPPWAVQLTLSVGLWAWSGGREASVTGWAIAPPPGPRSPAGRGTLGGTDSGCVNLLFMMDGVTSIRRSHRIWTVQALPRCPEEQCPEGTAAGVRQAQCICYEMETGNMEGHQQVHIMLSVEVLSSYLFISNSFCLKYFFGDHWLEFKLLGSNLSHTDWRRLWRKPGPPRSRVVGRWMVSGGLPFPSSPLSCSAWSEPTPEYKGLP